MARSDLIVRLRYAIQDLLDRQSLAYDSRRHHQALRCRALIQRAAIKTCRRRTRHALSVLHAAGTRNGVRTSTVNNNGPETFAFAPLEHSARHLYGSGLELVGGEHGRGVGGAVGCNEGEVGFGDVGGLDANVDARDEEAGRVGAGGGHVFGFAGGYGGVDWS